MMTKGNYGDLFNETKLPALKKKKKLAPKKRKGLKPMHERMAAAMENCK